MKAVWLRLAGYTNNGAMPEPGFDGTETDLSAGGEFWLRVMDPGPPAISIFTIDMYTLTDNEPNNPNNVGRSSTTNGLGIWLKWQFEPGPVQLGGAELHAFDLVGSGPTSGRFELLGTGTDSYAGGAAYNGNQPGAISTPGEQPPVFLNGDRVFMIEFEAVPEPSSLTLVALGCLALRRRSDG
jgi:hypothetical protein